MTDYWLALITVAAFLALNHRFNTIHAHLVEHLDRQTKHLERVLMSQAQDAINAVVAQLAKAKDEILTKIADLNIQVQDAGVADKVDLTELTAAAQALDDIVPDAVTDAGATGATGSDNPPF